jgi:chromate transport protein ChrA
MLVSGIPVDLFQALPSEIRWAIAIVVGVLVLAFGWWLLRRLKRAVGHLARVVGRFVAARTAEDVLTIVAAIIATGVSAQGMWRFSHDVLGFDGPLRLLLFAFIEVAVITSAVRARRNMRENYSAGIDGIAVWALTGLTAVLSSMDAHSIPEAMFRLAAPLVAAWLWERGMAIERHRITGRGRIHWRVTPERMMVRLGLAEASDRTAGEVDKQRRITRVALAAKKARALRQAGASDRKMIAAMTKLDKAMDRAVEHTGLARDRGMQSAMLDTLTALYGTARLVDLPGDAPWEHLDHPAVTGLMRDSEAIILSAALDRNTALRGETYPLPVATSDQDASNTATEPPTRSAPLIPPVRKRLAINPGDPRPVGAIIPFEVWTRPEPRPIANPLLLPPPAAGLDATRDTEGNEDAERTRPDDDQDADQKEPTDEDKRRVAKWWVKRYKAGEKLSKWKLAARTGFKPTWCGDRIDEGKEILLDEGWAPDDRGAFVPPADPVAEVDADLVATTPVAEGLNGAQR